MPSPTGEVLAALRADDAIKKYIKGELLNGWDIVQFILDDDLEIVCKP